MVRATSVGVSLAGIQRDDRDFSEIFEGLVFRGALTGDDDFQAL